MWDPFAYVLGLLGPFVSCLYSDSISLPHDVMMICWDMCPLSAIFAIFAL
jgi:hypothetical protein